MSDCKVCKVGELTILNKNSCPTAEATPIESKFKYTKGNSLANSKNLNNSPESSTKGIKNKLDQPFCCTIIWRPEGLVSALIRS